MGDVGSMFSRASYAFGLSFGQRIAPQKENGTLIESFWASSRHRLNPYLKSPFLIYFLLMIEVPGWAFMPSFCSVAIL